MDQVLDIATSAFMQHGFSGCSLSDLERATGLSRTSLYNAIGDKEDVFRAILKRFVDQKHQYMREKLQHRTIDEIIEVFEIVRRGEGPLSDTSGCMIATAAMDRERVTPQILEDVIAFREGEIELLREVFEAEKKRGALASGVDPANAATLLVTTIWGAAVTTRLFDSLAPLNGAVTQMIGVLKSWKIERADNCCSLSLRLRRRKN